MQFPLVLQYLLPLLFLLSSTHATAPSVPGFHLLWKDDFTGAAGSLPSANNWIIDTGIQYPGGPAHWGTTEVESYTRSPNNVKQSGSGNLVITALRSSSGQWTSGRIETRSSNFTCAPGKKLRVQASIKLPNITIKNGLGYWPAFWMVGHNFRGNYQNWPHVGELDILENVNGLSFISQAMHCGTDPGGKCNEPDGISSQINCAGTSCFNNFHTYEVLIDRKTSPEEVVWLVDGRQSQRVTATQLGSQLWAQTIHQGFFLVVNMAMGGAYPNALAGGAITPTAQTVSGRSMTVDYIAVYST